MEWIKPGLHPKYIHVHQDGRLEYQTQNPSYNFRTRLFVDELEQGNVSMKIFSVKLSDEGKYRCYIPATHLLVVVWLRNSD
uniref:Ig-like domain-containing protein n=1 Tax=Seriola lalandi dorsalis TaxID=1841481 RepID=A0A3B4XAF8_SERLL